MIPAKYLRDDFSTDQVLRIREDEENKGNTVNVRRIHSYLVEIEIIPLAVIDVTDYVEVLA